MKNTIENKRKFFSQYLFGQVHIELGWRQGWCPQPVDLLTVNSITDERSLEGCLLLRSLDNILDTDATNVAAIQSGSSNPQIAHAEYGKNYLQQFPLNGNVKVYQYLQSKGYALPYHNLSIEQLVEYGWIKLTPTL